MSESLNHEASHKILHTAVNAMLGSEYGSGGAALVDHVWQNMTQAQRDAITELMFQAVVARGAEIVERNVWPVSRDMQRQSLLGKAIFAAAQKATTHVVTVEKIQEIVEREREAVVALFIKAVRVSLFDTFKLASRQMLSPVARSLEQVFTDSVNKAFQQE